MKAFACNVGIWLRNPSPITPIYIRVHIKKPSKGPGCLYQVPTLYKDRGFQGLGVGLVSGFVGLEFDSLLFRVVRFLLSGLKVNPDVCVQRASRAPTPSSRNHILTIEP